MTVPPNSFKNEQGVWLTKGLFFELTPAAARKNAVFTLKEDDHVVGDITYFSLKKAFLACTDPTEYEFATSFLGGWQHWKKLQETADLKDHIADWREERDVALRSVGVQQLVQMARGEEASYQAAKWLADKGWEESGGKGRPKKSDIKAAAKEEAAKRGRAKSDLSRIKG